VEKTSIYHAARVSFSLKTPLRQAGSRGALFQMQGDGQSGKVSKTVNLLRRLAQNARTAGLLARRVRETLVEG